MPNDTRTLRSVPPSAPVDDPTYTRLRFPQGAATLRSWVHQALVEDRAYDDVTTLATVPADQQCRARVVAREAGVLCGVPFAIEAFGLLDASCQMNVQVEDGGHVDF